MEHDSDKRLTGTKDDDVLSVLDGGSAKIGGWGGDDILTYLGGAENKHTTKVMLAGNQGDDTLIATSTHRGQVHMYGAEGDDHLVMDVTRSAGEQSLFSGDRQAPDMIARHGHHAYGGSGADVFEFRNVDAAENKVIGRIDDFDASRDTIRIDGRDIDLHNPPEGVRIVGYKGQQWLLIDDKILYALEGARLETAVGEEQHFVPWPDEWADGVPASADEAWIDQKNVVAWNEYADRAETLNLLGGEGVLHQGTDGADMIRGGKGGGSSEEIHAGGGDDVIDAGTGHDTVWGGAGDDLIAGGTDKDVLHGGAGADRIWGGSEDDRVFGGEGDDALWGGTGNDLVAGGAGDDQIHGDAGNDVLFGGSGNDSIKGGAGNDWISGGVGRDDLAGQNGADIVRGGDGDDAASGGSGDDLLEGNDGADVLRGDGGRDLLQGHAGDDRLLGGADADRLLGGHGDDVLEGGAGADFLDGGWGSDVLTGGAEADTFRFKFNDSAHRDVVTDFEDDVDLLVFHSDTADFRDQDGGVMVTLDDGFEVFVDGWSTAQVNEWDYALV